MARTVKKSPHTALLLGCGYVGKAMIAPLRARGFDVIGTGRDSASIAEIHALGARGVVFDGALSDAFLAALRSATHIITSIPPTDKGDPVMNALGGDILSYSPNLLWSAYLSATSVYGDRNGQWAFEDELLFPVNPRGQQRIEAELTWLESEAMIHVFRLAGIYGPGRSPFAKIKSGKARAVIKEGHVVNRIHLDDIVSALLLSMDAPDPGQVYNLADGHPAPPQDVLDFAAGLIGAARPKRVDHDSADISDMARSFYRETKRISSARARRRLGWSPKLSDYKAGLRAILEVEGPPK